MVHEISISENGWVETLDKIAKAVISGAESISCTPQNQAQKESLQRIGFSEVQYV